MNGGHATTGLDLFVGGHVFDERGENIGPKQGLVFHYGTSVTRRRVFEISYYLLGKPSAC